MQPLLSPASWDADGVGHDIRGSVAEHLDGPGGMLVVQETR
jgi:hypothetical protein